MQRARLIAAVAGLILGALPAWSEAPSAAAKPASRTAGAARRAAPAGSWHARWGLYFQRNWGLDIVGVRRVSSGLMLRLDYRVVDPEKASVLSDAKTRPYAIDEATGTALAVPAMEKIGELRQVAPLELGRTYFVIFGNPGGLVPRGGRVAIVAGAFRADGLEVE
jgi:hypothetical protein